MSVLDQSPEERSKLERVLRKVSRRFVWFLFLLFTINFIDRGNIGIAALTMNRDLGISHSVFGLSLTIFSIGYAICEIPSNLLLARVGARRWFARIMVTWGLACAACALAWGPTSLIALRTIVGIAEAGFAPGLVLFITLWYPQFYRASAQAGFMVSQPVAGALGAMAGGLILGMTGIMGLAGWQWLYILEGIPAVILGIITWFYLTDRPANAKWLSAEERATLEGALKREAEQREAMTAGGERRSVFRLVLSKNMLILSFCFGCMVANFSAMGSWMPQIVKDMNAPGTPNWVIGFIAAIPSLCTIAAIPLWSMHSDRRREKFWHSIGAVLVGAVAWEVAATATMPALRMTALTVASVTTIAAWPIFFTLPASVLPREAHPAGIAFLNTVGIGGGAVSPLIMGILRDTTGSFAAPMAVMGLILAVGAGPVFLVPRRLLNGDRAPRPALAAAGE
ncbi:MAG TPA: MFS transporter [Stellaceae bacterium]|nr:MFS transporter [Stellaceae bacterium]